MNTKIEDTPFKAGDHVIVTAGNRAGTTGVVNAISNQTSGVWIAPTVVKGPPTHARRMWFRPDRLRVIEPNTEIEWGVKPGNAPTRVSNRGTAQQRQQSARRFVPNIPAICKAAWDKAHDATGVTVSWDNLPEEFQRCIIGFAEAYASAYRTARLKHDDPN